MTESTPRFRSENYRYRDNTSLNDERHCTRKHFIPALLGVRLGSSAARANLNFESIKKQGGWKNDATVREYIDEGRRFNDNIGTTLMSELERLVHSS